MKRIFLTLFTAAAFASAATAAAQSTMEKKPDKMMGKSTSMKGCVEAGSTAGTYMLTHVDMGKMAKDKMSKETTSTETMSKDKMGMMSDKVDLMGTTVDLSKHVGHKVTVMGMKETDGFMVKSVKMIAASCP